MPDALARDFGTIVRRAVADQGDPREIFKHLPATFIEPRVRGRWIFDHEIATRIAALLLAIDSLTVETHRRLFRVLLAGALVDVSNVVINGKGRRYRGSWDQRRRDKVLVDDLFLYHRTTSNCRYSSICTARLPDIQSLSR